VATNLAYPLADLVLLSLVVGAFVVTGRGGIRAWGLIAAGLAVFAVADVFFLVATAPGGYVHGALFDAGWNVAGALMALAAWWPAGRLERVAAEVAGGRSRCRSRLRSWPSRCSPPITRCTPTR